MSEAELLKLLERMEARVRRSFRNFARRARERLTRRVTEEALRTGAIGDLNRIMTNEIERFADQVVALPLEVGAASAAAVGVTFDVSDPQVVRRLQDARARLVRNLARDVVAQLNVIQVQLGPQVTLRQRAFELRQTIGLTGPQVQASLNYERLLREGSRDALDRQLRDRRFDRTVLGSINRGIPLTDEQITRMVTRYRERQLAYRANIIAQSEGLRAVGEGDEAFWQQKIFDGTFEQEQVFRRWVTQTDERVRGSHRAIHGTVKPMGEPFVTGNGFSLRFPGDPNAPASETVNCRCLLATRVRGQAQKAA